MKEYLKIVLFSMVFVLGAFLNLQAADAAKIGLVDFQKVLDNSTTGKAAQAEINKKGQAMEAEIRKMGEEAEALKNNLEREALVMSREAKEEKERELRAKVTDLRTVQNKHMQTFREAERELVQKIQKEVMDLVKEIGAKEGYQLILERRESGAIYFLDSMDITNQVIEAYNKRTGKGGK
ncbi:MAG: OmpH family outer membrane protein [Desulfobacterales bacterium]|nr:OmpH family outer membrane protein [Desulfobacterales bacterium]